MSDTQTITGFLQDAPEFSDLFLRAGEDLRIRNASGDVVPVGLDVSPEDNDIAELVQVPDLHDRLSRQGGQLDLARRVGGKRFRVNIHREGSGRVSAVMRHIKDAIPDLSDLGLPERVEQMVEVPQGLIQMTGATGSGKSTTLAAMVARLSRYPIHILTIEDPVEYVFPTEGEGVQAHITQRAVGEDTDDFPGALRAALRENPDVIMLGEIRDRVTAEKAIEAGETGHLVLTTAHTRSAPDTVQRLINLFEPELHPLVQHQLAGALVGIVSQTLIPRADGEGRVLASEVMTTEGGVAQNIRKGRLDQLGAEMQQGKNYGMQTLNESLAKLVHQGAITREAAMGRAYNAEALEKLLGGGRR